MESQELTNAEIDFIVSGLILPDQQTQVAVDYANNKTSNVEVQAYAKLAGSSWTYYVRTLNVVIGRTSEPAGEDSDVQIDLGPAKVVSRRHATIQYNGEFWELTVSGRNGVKVDRVTHKEGTLRLHSGHILDIGGVQMMFVLPDSKPKIAPGFRKRFHQLSGSASATQQPASLAQNYSRQSISSSSEVTPLLTSTTDFAEEVKSQAQFNTIYPPSTEAPVGMYPVPQNHMAQAQLMAVQYPPPLPQQVPMMRAQYDASTNLYPFANISAGYNGPLSANMGSFDVNAGASKNSYPKGVAIITQSQVRGFSTTGNQFFDQDFSTEDAKDIKPPYSYATMISQAILSTADHAMSLADIYDWIATKYSFYRFSKSGWQNSIRHNLSLNKAFEKVARKANEPGKGMKWQIVQQYKEDFQKKASQGDHIKGKSALAQMQRQVQMRQAASPAVPAIPAAVPAPAATATATATVSTIILATEPVDVEAATLVANLASSPQRGPSNIKAGPISPIKPIQDLYQGKESMQNKDTFSTPSKQPIREIDQGAAATGPFSDQYGYPSTAAVSDTGVGSVLAGLSPSPSRRYPTSSISQLEAYTPDRGSNLRGSIWKGGMPPSISKLTELTPLNKTISAESLVRAVGSNSTSSLASSNSSSSTISTGNTSISSPSEETKASSNINILTSAAQSGSNVITSSVVSVSHTPAPMKSNLQLMAPTSAQQKQLPSSFMPASSPAPFWKFMQLASTPVRANDFSPTKFSSPAVSSLRDRGSQAGSSNLGSGSSLLSGKRAEEGFGDLQNVDLTR